MFNKMEDDDDVEDVTMHLTDLFKEAALSSPKRETDGKPAAFKPEEEGWMDVVDKQIGQWVSSTEQKLKEEVSDLRTTLQLLCLKVGDPILLEQDDPSGRPLKIQVLKTS